MEIALFAAASLCFYLFPALGAIALRTGLSACLRFSPRAAVALGSISAFLGCLGMLLPRGGLRCVPPGQRLPAVLAGVIGGTLGRMALLMFTARFSGSLALARLQAIPLLLVTLLALLPAGFRRLPQPRTRTGLFLLMLPCAMLEGHAGCGALALLSLTGQDGVRRRDNAPASAALLLAAMAQGSALLLTLLSGGAQVFPPRMLIAPSLGAFFGGWRFEQNKKRGGIRKGLCAALGVYAVFAALAGIEQAFLIP